MEEKKEEHCFQIFFHLNEYERCTAFLFTVSFSYS
jgi:hypothetical protein